MAIDACLVNLQFSSTVESQLTSAAGATVITKTSKMRKAVKALVEVDIKQNRGLLKKKDTIDWEKEHGVRVEFRMDGRIQLNGDGGPGTLEGTTATGAGVARARDT